MVKFASKPKRGEKTLGKVELENLVSQESLPRRWQERKDRKERQVSMSCLPLRSLRLGGENAFILLRFFTVKTLGILPPRKNHLALLIVSA